MLALHFAKVVGHLDLTPEDELELIFGMLGESGVHPGSEILDELDRLISLAPKLVLSGLLEKVCSADPDVQLQSRWLQSHRLLSRVATRAGGDLLMEEVRARIASECISALAEHISFADSLPPNWLVELFEIAPDDEFGMRAIYNFMYPTGGWMGPESNMYRTSRSRAMAWCDAAGDGSKIGAWLTDIIETLDRQIAVAEAREAERGW